MLADVLPLSRRWLMAAAVGFAWMGTPAVADPPPVVYYDATGLFSLDLAEESPRRRFWDESHLLAALQGLVNRTGPQLFVRYVRAPDDFWWSEMTADGGWLAGRPVVRVSSLEDLLERFRDRFHGVVVYDERVPATSNLASTIAGCDDLLPVRYDPAPGSWYQKLTGGPAGLPVRVRLLTAEGAPLFTGSGLIPGTEQPSTGSPKNDAYRWLIEHYLKPGRANPRRLGYYLDAFWLRCWKASGPENHTLSNHDYVIAQRGVLFDLGVWEDEGAVDDPDQAPGTDAATLRHLLHAAWERLDGQEMIHAAGFVPWAYKYTSFRSDRWAAGGKHAEVPTEWRYAEILSCFNAYMDADALGLGAMANASFFQHYPLAPHYPQAAKPTREHLVQAGVLDAGGRIPRRGFVAHYVGDYDAAAWLYRELPRMWRDPARGRTPLSWAFNPNLAERFPFGMAWARQRATTNDWFVAGDSGAGYLNPGYLTPPRPHSGLPSGLAAWERHCTAFYRQWDLTLTGFVIDGYARGLAPEGLDAYARFSPDGIVAQKIPARGMHGGMPYLRMGADLPGNPKEAAQVLHSLASGPQPRFVVCRSILQSPTWYHRVHEALREQAGDSVQVVDLYTLLWLVREFETHRADYVDRRFVQAARVEATPGHSHGLAALHLADGPLDVVTRQDDRCWSVPRQAPARYLYFDADDEFCRHAGPSLVVELELFEPGPGRVILEYDSTDRQAPHGGAYRAVVREWGDAAPDDPWRTVRWRLEDARLAGAQNGGADLRFHRPDGDLRVRAVRINRLEASRFLSPGEH